MGDLREPEPGAEHYSTYVRNLPFDASDAYLRERFAPYGEIKDVYLPKDYYTGQPR
jgi:FUS-interacting serine-arginine-rich protein 1